MTGMIGYLLDTNIISETRKSNKSRVVMAWLAAQEVPRLFTSDLTMAELAFGAEMINDIDQRNALKEWILETVRPWMHDRILKITEEVLMRWRILSQHMQKTHKYSPEAEMLIAAVAFENDLVMVTRDQAPFILCGIPTLNPFTGERFNGA